MTESGLPFITGALNITNAMKVDFVLQGVLYASDDPNGLLVISNCSANVIDMIFYVS